MIKPSGIITFTSDFFTVDGYVGAVKGKILTLFPRATIIDISHEIPSGDIESAAWCLLTSTRYFPPGTVHMAVVDPGVGSGRRPIILEGGNGQIYTGPDNGIFHLASGGNSYLNLWEIDPLKLGRDLNISNTFHGRDIFAPAAALIAKGVSLNKFAKRVSRKEICKLDLDIVYQVYDKKIKASVIHVDKFGNLITSIPSRYGVIIFKGEIMKRAVGKPVSCYNDIQDGDMNFIEGSSGFMEVSSRGGSAAEITGARRGSEVTAYVKGRDL